MWAGPLCEAGADGSVSLAVGEVNIQRAPEASDGRGRPTSSGRRMRGVGCASIASKMLGASVSGLATVEERVGGASQEGVQPSPARYRGIDEPEASAVADDLARGLREDLVDLGPGDAGAEVELLRGQHHIQNGGLPWGERVATLDPDTDGTHIHDADGCRQPERGGHGDREMVAGMLATFHGLRGGGHLAHPSGVGAPSSFPPHPDPSGNAWRAPSVD